MIGHMLHLMIIIYHHSYETVAYYISFYQRYVRISLISTDVTNSGRYQQSSFRPTSTSTLLDATTSHQASLIVLKFIVLLKVLL